MPHAHVCSWNVHVIYAFHAPFGSCRHLSQSSSIIFGWIKARLSQHSKWTHWLINIHIIVNCDALMWANTVSRSLMLERMVRWCPLQRPENDQIMLLRLPWRGGVFQSERLIQQLHRFVLKLQTGFETSQIVSATLQKHSKTKPQCQTSVPKCTKNAPSITKQRDMLYVSLWFFMYLYVIWCNFASWNAHRLTMTDLPRCKQTQLKAALH
jgi:hypothetical protein